MIKKDTTKRGYAIIELLFYIALFVVLSLVVISAMITMARSFREISLQSDLTRSGAVMERISREIRQAHDISLIGAGSLELNTKDEAGADKLVKFLLSGSDVQLWENGVLTGNLNAPGILISNLTFTQITTAGGKAVKISLAVQSGNDALNRAYDFYDTVVLRGSY